MYKNIGREVVSLQVITIDDSDKWDDVVRSFEKYSAYYLSDYARAFQLQGDGTPLLFYFNDGITRAMNVVMKRDIAKDKNFIGKLEEGLYFDFSTPYGYGGFVVEGDDTDELHKEYNQYCKDNRIISEFVRFDLFSGFANKYDGYIETRMHNVIRSLSIDPAAILMDFKHKVRSNLRRAEENNLAVKIDYSGNKINDFLAVYYNTMKRNEADNFYYFPREFFNTLNLMKNNVAYFYVLFGKRVISVELVLYDDNTCYSYLGGTDCEYFHLRPNEFLKYEIIKWAYERGLKNYVLGGGYGEDDRLFSYKKSFAPNGIVNFYIGGKIFNLNLYKKILSIRRKEQVDMNSKFFPAYRG